MKLVYPEFLWAFLLLVIPIIIHLFNFKRYKTLYFSSLIFLKSVTQQTRSTQKLKYLITLFLRLLALAALILAFAQPYTPGKSSAGATGRNILAVYIDNSFSMEARGSSGSIFNESKDAARKILESLSPGTNLMQLSNKLSASELRFISQTEWIENLDKLDFYPSTANLPSVLNAVSTKLESETDQYKTQLVLFSDFQKGSLEFSEPLSDSTLTVYPVQILPQNKSNVYIDSVWFEQPLRKINTNNEVFVRVINAGTSDLNNVSLNLKVNDYQRQTLIDIPASGSKIAAFNYTDKQPGWKTAFVEIEDDQLYFDDVFYFAYEVKKSMSVIIVNDTESRPNVAKVFETEPYFNVDQVNINQLQPQQFVENDVIILNGLTSIPSGINQLIADAISSDKSVLILPTEKIDVISYNNLLSRLQLPIIDKLTSNALQLNKINYEDPYFGGVFDKKPLNIQLPKVLNYFKSTTTSKTNAIPLVQFENGSPLFVQSGSGTKAFVFYAGVDDSFGRFHEHILFSTLLLRSAELSKSSSQLWLTLGTDESFSVPRPRGFQGALRMKNSPSSKTQNSIEIIPPAIQRGGVDFIYPNKNDLGLNLQAGYYSIIAENQLLKEIAINYNRSESEMDYHTLEEVIEILKSNGIKNVVAQELSSAVAKDQFRLDKPTEYWRILLILGLIFLMLEMIITTLWRF